MRALATLLLVCPIAVLAEDASPAARWSLGAGISTTVIYVSNPGGEVAWGISQPSAGASLERRLTESNWLILAVDGSLGEVEQDLVGAPGTMKWESRRLTVNFGLRHVLTGPEAPVDVSVYALASGGWSKLNRTSDDAMADQELSGWLAGGNVGLAIDRRLTEGLSLRVATPLAGVWWQRSREESSGGHTHGRSFDVNVYLQPRLELRLAF